MTRYLNDTGDQGSSSTPWARDYARDNPGIDKQANIIQVNKCSTGLLIIAHQWKSFAFAGSKLERQVLEAIEYYMSIEGNRPALVSRILPNGNVLIGVDEDQLMAYWHQDGNVYYQKFNGGDGNASGGAESNPLIPHRHPPRQASAKKPSSSTTESKGK